MIRLCLDIFVWIFEVPEQKLLDNVMLWPKYQDVVRGP